MKTVISVCFRQTKKVYYFDPGDIICKKGDYVIVETVHGMEFGEVVADPHDVEEKSLVAPLKPITRLATEEDIASEKHNREREKEALDICIKKTEEHKLDMKLVNAEYAFNGSKLTFYFTAEGRIDFRELVKNLASVFKTRIELRQIGVRDEARLLGGLGCCGRPVCCNAFLGDFHSVSIKMAKEQNLSLSPTKISGLCGRLMCCLKYEQEGYECMRKQMPRVGREVITPDGTGTVLENNVVTEKTRVRVALADGSFDVRSFHFSDLKRTGKPEKCCPNTAANATESKASAPSNPGAPQESAIPE